MKMKCSLSIWHRIKCQICLTLNKSKMKYFLLVTFVLGLYTSSAIAQGDLEIALKDAPKPDIYIDGKKYDFEIFELLDQSKIESVNVIKDEQAAEKYNAPNGVIIIKTKKAAEQEVTVDEDGVKVRPSDKHPMVFIDGKESNQDALSKLKPENIESIEVLKGDKAVEEYNAPNGVVIVTMKK